MKKVFIKSDLELKQLISAMKEQQKNQVKADNTFILQNQHLDDKLRNQSLAITEKLRSLCEENFHKNIPVINIEDLEG